MKNTQLKEPFPIKAIRWTYPKLETIAPPLAHKVAWNLFFSPFRFKKPQREEHAYQSARSSWITVNNKKVRVFEWGEKGAPIALLVHGWSGRATQFYMFIAPLVAEGYRVIAFDAPAHGDSEGKQTHIAEFADVIFHLEKTKGKINIGIGHSFGGISLLYAKKEGLDLNTIIMISSPTIGEDILTGFRKKINASAKTSEAMRKMVQTNFHLDFEDITACELVKKTDLKNHLIIHDKDDLEVPYQNAEALKKASKNSKLLLTSGLGHTRILRDQSVLDTIINFIDLNKD
ncbi:MAG: alpha/beta hydrolase [Cyclobacteriaceae bacterium]|nr:alpha/beta hydrolase [Cyclobacteriaceae bacterium]